VLSAGGARAAYQVGVLKHLADHCPHFDPRIFTGISAGSINAAYLAQGAPIRQSAHELYELWRHLEFDQVFQTNFTSLFKMGVQWVSDLLFSKILRRPSLRSLLDASPLSKTLIRNTHFWRISRAIRSGQVLGIAITATNYHDGTTTTFYDSHHPVTPWFRNQRRSERTFIRLRHVMASCSIPLLFEPVLLGDRLYGDGSLRFNFPFSPAFRLGASKVLAIGIRSVETEDRIASPRTDHLSLGFVAGSVLNSIFLDSLEFDYENVCRINRMVGPNSPNYVPVHLVRPSRDLGALSVQYLSEVPFHFRQLLRASATPAELGDLLSYLMFSKGYLKALLELGRQDAANQHDALEKFLS